MLYVDSQEILGDLWIIWFEADEVITTKLQLRFDRCKIPLGCIFVEINSNFDVLRPNALAGIDCRPNSKVR